MVQSTSVAAYYERVRPKLGEKQAAVIRTMRHSDKDWSNNELARSLGWPINTVTPRVKELREMGLVTLSRKRKCGITGLLVNAWRPVRGTYQTNMFGQ